MFENVIQVLKLAPISIIGILILGIILGNLLNSLIIKTINKKMFYKPILAISIINITIICIITIVTNNYKIPLYIIGILLAFDLVINFLFKIKEKNNSRKDVGI